jgi:hypothetical protein
MWGTCISCGKGITVESCDAGHYVPASSCGRDLLFDPLNISAECSRCNAFDEGHLIGYAAGLDKRYGSGTATSLRLRWEEYKLSKQVVKDFPVKQYEEMIQALPSYQQRELEVAYVPSILHSLP